MTKMKDRKIERLAALPVFGSCTPEQLRSVAASVDEVDVGAGTTLVVEGRLVKEFLVIESGTVCLSSDDLDAGRLMVGDRIGDTELVTGEPAPYTIVAETDCRLAVLDARRFYAMIETVPAVARHLLKDHALRSRRANDRAFGIVVPLAAFRVRPATA